MMRRILRFLCFFIKLACFVRCFENTTPVNDKWICEGCETNQLPKGVSKTDVFAMVRRALSSQENREVYLNFDSSWMGRLLKPGSKVIVVNVDRKDLSRKIMPEVNEDPKSYDSEIFRIVISFPSPGNNPHDPLSYTQAKAIDDFLVKNPCYIPIKDPPVLVGPPSLAPVPSSSSSSSGSILRNAVKKITSLAKGTTTPTATTRATSPTTTKTTKTTKTTTAAAATTTTTKATNTAKALKNGRSLLNHHRSSNNNQDTFPFYEGVAILGRLPTYGFKATCMLYTYITRNQFPKTCPKANEKNKYLVNLIGTIGYFNLLHPMIENMIGALHNDRVLLTPRAWDQGEFHFPDTVIKAADGSVKRAKEPWASWTDIKECHINTYAYDPWNCHFISLSSCNTPELHDLPWNGSEFRLPDPSVEKSRYLTYLRDKIIPARLRYGDAPQLNGTWIWSKCDEWEYTRVMQFVQRPVIQLRARLRRSLRSIVQLAVPAFNQQQTVPASNLALTSTSTAAATTSGITTSSNRPHHLKIETCVAIHVRHGDSAADGRSESGIDRSLNAHMTCGSPLLHDLGGIVNIFLATDDPNLRTLAPKQYPQYNWYMQQRALRDSSELYDFHFEKSKQQDIAGILADAILSARCSGMIGAFDSGFVDVLYQAQCGKSEEGVCPPMKDVLRCQGTVLVNPNLRGRRE